MDRLLDERMALAGLAHRRYPNEPILLAIEFFQSDRRRADLGALDERKRRGRGSRKWRDFMSGEVRYDIIIDRPERDVYPEMSLRDFDPNRAYAEEYVTIQRIPALREYRRLPVARSVLETQSGRSFLARELRSVRREMRRSAERAHKRKSPCPSRSRDRGKAGITPATQERLDESR